MNDMSSLQQAQVFNLQALSPMGALYGRRNK